MTNNTKMREAMIDQDGAVWEKIGGAWSLYKPTVPVMGEPLTCDECGAATDDPWHSSESGSRHFHRCDACHTAALEAQRVPVVGEPPENAAKSIASMIEEWVQECIKNGGNWQECLPTLIQHRLKRFWPTHSIPAADLARLLEKAAMADDLRGKLEISECGMAAALAEGDRIMSDWQEQIRKTCAALKQRNDAEKERDDLRKALLALKEDCQTSNDCQYGTLSTSHVARIVDAAITQEHQP